MPNSKGKIIFFLAIFIVAIFALVTFSKVSAAPTPTPALSTAPAASIPAATPSSGGITESGFWSDPLAYLNPGSVPSIQTGVQKIVNGIVLVAEVVFVILFLIGGVMYLTSSGVEESASKARKLLISAVIGIVIVLAGWAIGTWVLDVLTNGNTSSPSFDTGAGNTKFNGTAPTPEVVPNNNGQSPTPTPNNSGPSAAACKQCLTEYDNQIANVCAELNEQGNGAGCQAAAEITRDKCLSDLKCP